LKDLTVPVATTPNLKTGCNVLRIVDLNRRQPAISQTCSFLFKRQYGAQLAGLPAAQRFQSLSWPTGGKRAASAVEPRSFAHENLDFQSRQIVRPIGSGQSNTIMNYIGMWFSACVKVLREDDPSGQAHLQNAGNK
jgi:hypothetical protein